MGLIAYAKRHSVAKQHTGKELPSATKPAEDNLAPGTQAQARAHLIPQLNLSDPRTLPSMMIWPVGSGFPRDPGLQELVHAPATPISCLVPPLPPAGQGWETPGKAEGCFVSKPCT